MGSARGHVGTQGPAPLTVQRQEFARLIAAGVNNSEACRLVGVNRRTGTRWRFGRTVTSSSGFDLHYAPVAMTKTKALSARFLSEDERVLIGDRFRAGASLRAIGRDSGARRPRSAGKCNATVTRAEAIARSPPTGWPCGVWHVRRRAGWPATRSCEPRSRGGLSSVGAPNRSLTPCGWSIRTTRPGTWSTRASTRRSTTRTLRWDATGSPACAPDGHAGGDTAAQTHDELAACER